MTDSTPESPEPEEAPASERPRAEEARTEPYDAAEAGGPTVDTTASDPAEEEAVEGEHPWPVTCHLSLFANVFAPMAAVVGPVLIREWKRKEDPEVDWHAKEALNFQLNVIPAAILLFVTCLMASACPLLLPALIGLPILLIAATMYAVIAAMKASEGKRYRYPFIYRFVD